MVVSETRYLTIILLRVKAERHRAIANPFNSPLAPANINHHVIATYTPAFATANNHVGRFTS